MKITDAIKSFVLQSTTGGFATAVFVICGLSGMILALPFDIARPYASVSHFILTNPWADFSRNLHYWSAQAFLVLALWHAWNHLKKNLLQHLTAGVWLRLCFSFVFIFYVMLSGYFLKGDLEGLEARHILQMLLGKIPFAGDLLSSVFLGHGQDLQVVYVHHIATATIFLAIVIIEHAGSIWSKRNTLLFSLAMLTAMSLLFRAPLHDGLNPVIKGPWYFVGFQELLHWISLPQLALLLVGMLLIIIYSMRWIKQNSYPKVLWLLRILAVLYLFLTIIGTFFRGENWEFVSPFSLQTNHHLALPAFDRIYASEIPSNTWKVAEFKPILGRYESCLACHTGMKGLSASHDPASIGCVSCHAGDPFAVTRAAAHRGMVLVPGNLSNARLSCGTQNCHSDITNRIHTSMMATVSGMIAVDKWVFGETDSPDLLSDPSQIRHSPADEHLRNLCLGCHLGQDKKIPGAPDELSKGGGCNACHLVYDKTTAALVKDYYASGDPLKKLPAVHPNLSLQVTDDKCFSCHNRSGRISTSYEGYFETQRDITVMEDLWQYKIIEGHRVFERKEDDIHHRGGMSCVDCHNSYEMMGDGKKYQHKEDAVSTRCEDCHTTKPNVQHGITGIDAESGKILGINPFLKDNRNFIKNQNSGRIYVNTEVPALGNPILTTKNSGKKLTMKPPHQVCISAEAHKSLTCIACHALQAPTCLGCHNQYNNTATGYDQVQQKEISGSWTESAGIYGVRPPTLGIREGEKGKREVIPFVPGMIMTIDLASHHKKAANAIIFKRLYAPIDPHNTAAQGRSCKSCHNEPATLGYGEGQLVYASKAGLGKWSFSAKYENIPADGLPEDAWQGFMKERKDAASTRSRHRPFNMEEQRRILRVGACLTCHDDNSEVMQQGLRNFEAVFSKRTKLCTTPAW